MSEIISLNHGSGGSLMRDLINGIFAGRFGMSHPLTDSALIGKEGGTLAFTTDSYVVDPLFFPGGDIGKIALCGTVNDLAVSGAIPLWIAASFIIEEGFPVDDLKHIADSMASEAVRAGVCIVTGDTKVVGKGKCDKLFITTSGVGLIRAGLEHLSKGSRIKAGDKLIVNGPIGNHAIAVLGARNNLSFSSVIESDCSSLNGIIQTVLDHSSEVHFMRDLTRGGLAAVLNEVTEMTSLGISAEESNIPVDDPVKGLCEMLGFNLLSLANEGKFLLIAAKEETSGIIDIMRSHPLGENAAVIGEITEEHPGYVVLNTITGGKRILEMPSGLDLPRIC